MYQIKKLSYDPEESLLPAKKGKRKDKYTKKSVPSEETTKERVESVTDANEIKSSNKSQESSLSAKI